MPIDELRVLLENKTGQMATIYITFNAPRPETTLNVVGNEGIMHANLSNNMLIKKRYRKINLAQVTLDNIKTMLDITISSVNTTSAILTRRYKGMHVEFVKEFEKSILNDGEPPVTAEEALKVVKLCQDLSLHIQKRYFTKED